MEQTVARAEAGGVRVQEWTTDNGLPSQSVSDIAQDSAGFIWVAAGGFVVRLDGVGVQVLGDAPMPVPPPRRVARVHVGLGDTVWMLDEASAVFSLARGVLQEEFPLSEAGYTELVQARDGALYAASGTALWRLGRDGLPSTPSSGAASAPDGPVQRPLRDAAGTVWFVTSGRQLVALNTDGASRSVGRAPVSNVWRLVPAPDGRVLGVRLAGSAIELVDGDGQAWGRWDSPLRVGGRSLGAAFEDGEVEPVALDDKGRLWVAARDGYRALDPALAEPAAFVPASLELRRARALLGRSGCLWLADVAVRKVCPVALRTLGAPMRTGDPFSPGPDNTVLVWDTSGFVLARRANGSASPAGPRIPALHWARAHVDARGALWWSLSPTVDAGAERTVGAAIRLLPHRGATRFGTVPGTSDQAWYHADGWLYHARLPAVGPAVLLDSVSADGVVTDLRVARDGTLWATTRNVQLQGDLISIRSGTVSRLSAADGLPAAAFRTVRPDENGGAWLGTYGAGLVHVGAAGVRRFTTDNGLAEDIVTSLLDDGRGNLWMHGNRSVHRVAWRDLEARRGGERDRVFGVAYGRADGLRTPETTGSSGIAGEDGTLWFPTIAGVSVVDVPAALRLDSAPPQVHIVSVTADGYAPRVLLDGDALPSGARRVSIQFAAPGTNRDTGVRFGYRIDGLDAAWIDAGTARVAVYSDLPPGRHRFRLRAVNAGGVATEEDAELTFSVPPLFRETPQFFALAVVLLGSAVLLGIRSRERGLQVRARALEGAVQDRTVHLESALRTVESQASQLRVLDETRARFFANVSHEFRTPLSLILGPVDDLLASDGTELDATSRRRLDLVSRNARRLRQLVEQLLDAARLEAGTMPVKTAIHDLVPTLRRLSDSYASLASARNITFRLSCPVGGLRIRCDADHIEKIVGNLVGNALKFTGEGGAVELRVRRDDVNGRRAVRFEVSDDGPGIAPEHHGRIFERFGQVDNSSSRAHEGTGIGLALVKELVHLHGGTVWLQSAPGQGSTFVVRLPAEATDSFAVPTSAAAQEPAADTAGVSARVAASIPDSAPTSGPSRSALPIAGSTSLLDVPSAALSGERQVATRTDEREERALVLLVEDNADLLEWLQEHIVTQYRVLTATDGVQGLAMARQHKPDVIVSDLMMPNMDGQSLCAAVRADPDIDFIPFLLLTARASRESRLDGLRIGADAYLAKPVDLAELMVSIGGLAASRRRMKRRLAALPSLPAIAVPVAQPPRDDEDRALLQALGRVLALHLDDEQFTSTAMADALGMSRSSLYRRLQPLLGQSPMDAVWEYRLLQGAQWLTDTGITISEIAFGVGFKSVPHFSARFRERFGETPSQHRARHLP